MSEQIKLANSLEECELLAEQKRNEIRSTKDSLEFTGTVYYISNNGNDNNSGKSPEEAWATVGHYLKNTEQLMPGDAVLFERGSTFRLTEHTKMVNGVTYGAYGEGSKPVLLGSEDNYAGKGYWSKVGENLWKCTLEDDWDAGNMFFDEGKYFGWKRRYLKDCKKDFDFCHDRPNKTLYLYLTGESPETRFYNIEIGRRFHGLYCFGSTDIVIDNLCIKYTAAHGIALFDAKNVKVSNCEIGYIGGAYHSYNYEEDGNLCRFGNGIENYGRSLGFTIENCWVYQCYDAGITPQGTKDHDGVLFKDNLLEYSVYNIEFWSAGGNIKNMKFTGNFLRYGGFGFGEYQRTENNCNSQINCFINHWPDAHNIEICDNIFEGEYRNTVYWRWTGDPKHPGLDIYGNTFYNNGKFRMNYGTGCIYAVTQEQFEKNIFGFDRAPKGVRMFEYKEMEERRCC